MTERALDSDLQTGAESPVFNYVMLVDLAFASGTLYVHNGVGTYVFGGNNYLGVGALGSIGVMEETVDLIDTPIVLGLSPIDDDILNAILTEDVFGKDANIYLGSLNDDGELEGTPTQWISGWMESIELNIGSTDGVSIKVQNRASRLNARNNKRYTLEEHQAEHAGDLFLEFLPYVMDAQPIWNGERVRAGYVNTTGFTGGDTTSPDLRDPLGRDNSRR